MKVSSIVRCQPRTRSNILASCQQPRVCWYRPYIRVTRSGLVEEHLRMVWAPVFPRWRGIGSIKFFIRIQGQDDIYEGLVEGLDKICIIIWSCVTQSTNKVVNLCWNGFPWLESRTGQNSTAHLPHVSLSRQKISEIQTIPARTLIPGGIANSPYIQFRIVSI